MSLVESKFCLQLYQGVSAEGLGDMPRDMLGAAGTLLSQRDE